MRVVWFRIAFKILWTENIRQTEDMSRGGMTRGNGRVTRETRTFSHVLFPQSTSLSVGKNSSLMKHSALETSVEI